MSDEAKKHRHERHPDDHYGTPEWCVRAVARHVLPSFLKSDGVVIEPSAGDGAIIKALLALNVEPARIVAVEQSMERAEKIRSLGVDVLVGDTLTYSYAKPSLIIMNPPYTQAREHVEHAIKQAAPWGGTVVALLRLGFLGSKRRIPFWQKYPADVLVLPERPSFTADGKSDASEYAWFCWGPERGGRWQIMELDESCSPVKRRRQRKLRLTDAPDKSESAPPANASEQALASVAQEAASEPTPALSPITTAVNSLFAGVDEHEKALNAALASKDEWLAKQAARSSSDELPDFG